MNPSEFGQLYAAVLSVEATGFARPAALATIVRTQGSTFRHAGARMLVHADGEVVCALSGGCPQRDIVQRAQAALAQDRALVARYGRDSALDVLIEMGCGGELDVLIEPLRSATDTRFLHALARVLEQRSGGSLATVFAEHSGARARHLVQTDEVLFDDMDDSSDARGALQNRSGVATWCEPRAFGSLLLERFQPAPLLVLIGVNAVALALAQIGAALGWKSVLVAAAAGAQATELPAGASCVVAAPAQVRSAVPCDAQCAVVSMTFNLEQDIAYLRALCDAPFGYFGAIGSRERSAKLRSACPQVRLFAPAGIDLGADDPAEIALSIAAEIVARRHAREARSLSAKTRRA